MTENKQDESQVLETETNEESTTGEESHEETSDETQTDSEKEELRKKLEETEKKNKQLFERLKKAEKAPKTSNDSLSNKDILFLAKADIHEEDLDDVLDWAKFKGISVPEAYKALKATLDVKAEQRRSAQVAATNKPGRGVKKESAEDIMRRAEKGEVLKPDDFAALAQARDDEKTRSLKERRQ